MAANEDARGAALAGYAFAVSEVDDALRDEIRAAVAAVQKVAGELERALTRIEQEGRRSRGEAEGDQEAVEGER